MPPELESLVLTVICRRMSLVASIITKLLMIVQLHCFRHDLLLVVVIEKVEEMATARNHTVAVVPLFRAPSLSGVLPFISDGAAGGPSAIRFMLPLPID